MKRQSLFYGGLWPLLCWIFIPLLLLLITLMFKWRDIEQDVASNASESLSSQGFEWASTETFNHGRTVIIKGVAPSQEIADQALEVAKQAKGVDKVEFHPSQVLIAPKSPPYLNAIVTQNSIVLRGTLKNQAAADQLINHAASVFGAENVLNKLSIGENTGDFIYHNGLFEAIRGKGNKEPFSASFNNDTLTLTGQTINTLKKAEIGQNMAQITGLPINNNINVVLPPPPEPTQAEICLGIVQEILSNGKIQFSTGNALISQDSFGLLQGLAKAAQDCPDSRFVIAGHTDSTGNLEFNQQLSGKRAQAVVDHLINLGLSATRFSAIGYGPSQPIADNDTEIGRAENRRIEFKLQTEQNSTNIGETE